MAILAAGCGRVGYDAVAAATADVGGKDGPVHDGLGAPADVLGEPAVAPADVAEAADAGGVPDSRPADAPAGPGPDLAPADAESSRADVAVVADNRGPGLDAASSACRQERPEVYFCEDFDLGPPAEGGTTFKVVSSQSRVAVVSSPTNRGAGALEAAAVGFDASSKARLAFYQNVLPSHVTTGAVYARAHILVPGGPKLPSWAIVMQLATGGDAISAMLGAADDLHLAVTPASYEEASAAGVIKRDRWFCLQLEVIVAAAGRSGQATLKLDGSTILQTPVGVNTLPPGGWALAPYGLITAGDNDNPRIIIDDVAVSPAPLPCVH